MTVAIAILLPFSGSIPIFLLLLAASCALSSIVYVQHYKKQQLCRELPDHLGYQRAWSLSFSVVIAWSTFTCSYFLAWMSRALFQAESSSMQFGIEIFIDTLVKTNLSSVIVEADDFGERLNIKGEKEAITTELLILIDTANAPIFGVDTELLITEWNQKAAQITGYSKEEVLGQPLVDTYITDEYKDPVRAVLTAAATGGQQAASFEFPLYTKTGERVELLLNATTRRGADGEVMGVLGVGLDMTEVRLVQGHLDKSEKAKLTVWHCMHEGVAIIEGHDVLNGEILECNHAMCELSGVATPDQLRGTSLRQILLQVSGTSSEEQIFEICFAGSTSDSVTKCCGATFKKFQT